VSNAAGLPGTGKQCQDKFMLTYHLLGQGSQFYEWIMPDRQGVMSATHGAREPDGQNRP